MVELSTEKSKIWGMGYEAALNKSWNELAGLTDQKSFSLKFLADEYSVDLVAKKVFSLSCNAPAKDFTSIIILHYLVSKLKGLPSLSGEWLPFRELAGIEGYFSAFRKRSIEPIIRKYGSNPEGLLTVLERLPGKKAERGDVGIILDAFENVPVLIDFWRSDAEFGPDANILFDRSIARIFCIEDIVVLAGLIAASI